MGSGNPVRFTTLFGQKKTHTEHNQHTYTQEVQFCTEMLSNSLHDSLSLD